MKIFKFLTWIGIIMIIGAAGSSDVGTMDFGTAVVQTISGVLLSFASYFMYALTYKPKTKSKRARIVPIEELRKVG